MRISLQSRCKRRIKADHPIMPWLKHHAAFVLDICKLGQDGRTRCEARKGKRVLRPMPETGECILYLRPQSVGKDKLDTQWEQGVFAGVRAESGQIYVLSAKGAIKVRDYKRKPEKERWNQEEFAGIQGLPWDPVPGRNQVEVKSHVQHKEEEEILTMPSNRESMLRRIYIRKEDVSKSKYGLTLGCRGCEAANRGLVGVHSEDCRARIEQANALKEPERSERINQILTKLNSHEEGNPEESAGKERDEPNSVLKEPELD